MNLYVRTQDRRTLKKVESLCFHIEGEFWGIYESDAHIDYLGLYKSPERCEEILDEMQKFLDQKIIVQTKPIKSNTLFAHKAYIEYINKLEKSEFVKCLDGGVDVIPTPISSIVYQMPKE